MRTHQRRRGRWHSDTASRGVAGLGRFQSRLSTSAETLLEALRTRDEWQAVIWRLRWYPAMGVKTDATDSVAAERHQRAMTLITRVNEALAYFEPELLAIDPAQFAALCEAEPALQLYAHALDQLRRRAAHICTADIESVIAAAGDLASSPDQTYKVLVNGELRFGTVRTVDGSEITVESRDNRHVDAAARAANARSRMGSLCRRPSRSSPYAGQPAGSRK